MDPAIRLGNRFRRQVAIKNYSALTHEMAPKAFGSFMDVMAQNDGSNVLDTIVAVNSGSLTVNLANYFQSGQYVDIFTSTNGVFVTTLQVADEDPNGGNVIHTTTAIPGTVTARHGNRCPWIICNIQFQDVRAALLQHARQQETISVSSERPTYPGYVANGVALNNQGLTQSVISAACQGSRSLRNRRPVRKVAESHPLRPGRCCSLGIELHRRHHRNPRISRSAVSRRHACPKIPRKYMGGRPESSGPDEWG